MAQVKQRMKLPSHTEFKIGDVRQLRRNLELMDGSMAPAGASFVIVDMFTVRSEEDARHRFTQHVVLWSTDWTNTKKAPPKRMILTGVQGFIRRHTRTAVIKANLPKQVPVIGPHFGRAARPEEKVK